MSDAPFKVTLGTVFGQEVDSWYYQSMVQLLLSKPPEGYAWSSAGVSARSGPLLAMARAHVLGNFIQETDGDCLVLIDTDQQFSPERFWDLVACFRVVCEEHSTPEAPIGIVAGVTWMSGHPKLEKPLPNIFYPGQVDGQFIHAHTYPANSLIEVGAVGSSNLVISRDLAQQLVDAKINPYHHVSILNWDALAADIAGWDDVEKIRHTMKQAVQNADQLGEDLSFCYRVREAGYRILCHTGLEFAHSKNYLLDGEDYRRALAERFPDGIPDQESP